MPFDHFFWRVLFILAAASAGGVCFFAYLNRALMFIPDNRLKKTVVILHFAAFTLGPSAAAALSDPAVWWPAPPAVFALALVGELHRLRVRRRHAGSPPVRVEHRESPGLNPITTLDLATVYYSVENPDWPAGRLRVTHLSDIHLSDSLPWDYFTSAIAQARDTSPDLIVLTGDFVSRPRHLDRLAELLAPIGGKTTIGILGNHDHWVGAEAVMRVATESGIRMIGNSSVDLRTGAWQVEVIGCESPWGARKWAAPEARGAHLRLALTHTADNIYRLARAGADAVFAGHYHAGQLRLPWFGPMVIPSIYGRRYDHGHFRIGPADLFVTAGIGSVLPRFRFFCRPDIFVVDFLGRH